jgi:hypothetical protein
MDVLPARRILTVGILAALVTLVSPAAGSAALASAAPTPPGMQKPLLVFLENFQNSAGVSPIFVQTLADYPNGSVTPSVPGYVGATGVRYSADPQWNGEFCNGLIVSQSATSTKPELPQTDACSDNGWTEVRNLAGTLGKWQADPDYPYAGLVPGIGFMSNLAVSSYTEGTTGAGVQLSTQLAGARCPGTTIRRRSTSHRPTVGPMIPRIWTSRS